MRGTFQQVILSLLMLWAFTAPAQEVFSFQYQVRIGKLPKQPAAVSVLVPTPTSSAHQTVQKLSVETPHDYEWLKEGRFQNKYLRLRFEGDRPDSVQLTLRGQLKRIAVNGPAHYRQASESVQPFLRPDSLIPLEKPIQQEVQKALQKADEGFSTPRAFYDHLMKTMTYDKSGEGWGRGDAIYACNAKTGNCTDFHSLFIGMCRSKEIPARFHIGFPLDPDQQEGTVKGYHCWAEFFQQGKGWVPVDISEASKHPDKQDFYYGSLDPHRITFTSGRDIQVSIAPGQQRQLNYFVYPKMFANGKLVEEGVETRFQYQLQD